MHDMGISAIGLETTKALKSYCFYQYSAVIYGAIEFIVMPICFQATLFSVSTLFPVSNVL